MEYACSKRSEIDTSIFLTTFTQGFPGSSSTWVQHVPVTLNVGPDFPYPEQGIYSSLVSTVSCSGPIFKWKVYPGLTIMSTNYKCHGKC